MTKHGIVREKHEFTLAKLRQINNIMLNTAIHHGLREPGGGGSMHEVHTWLRLGGV